MRERWKRYIEIGILLVMTAWVVKTGVKQEFYPQQEVQWEQNPQTKQSMQSDGYLQPWHLVQSEPILQSELFSQADQEPQAASGSTGQSMAPGTQSNTLTAMLDEDTDLYAQCLPNLHQGNNMVYADGYYYFRSQTQNYSLCRTTGAGMPVEVVADQVPGAIYVREDQVFFINVSDNRTLYCVGTDGSGLKQLSDFPMQELVVVEDRVYFRSVYDREYDPFYQLTEAPAEDDRYLYSMKLDGSDRRLLIPQVCQEFTTDGESLYYVFFDGTHDAVLNYALCQSRLDGTEEKQLCRGECFSNLFPWQGQLYWVDCKKKQLVRMDGQGEKEILTSNVLCFTISDGQAYVINLEEIRRIDLTTRTDMVLVRQEDARESSGQDRMYREFWYMGWDNRGMFLVNGQLFVKYFESEEKGILWHIWDETKNRFTIFEDMEPLEASTLVSDTSASLEHGELLFYYPGREDAGTEQYLDGEFSYEESYGTRADGMTYGDFHITLPRFHSNLASCEQMNLQMERLMELAMEDKEDFFQEMEEQEVPEESCHMWYRRHGYCNCYVDENYVSMFYYRGGYEGGMREWRESMPLIFDRGTGELLHMDDLFTVERNFYMKRLTGAIYKYFEMDADGSFFWNGAFDNNVLTKKLGDLRCYLTPDGIVLCYDRYEITAGAEGNPTFEIPYEWFEDIFRQ